MVLHLQGAQEPFLKPVKAFRLDNIKSEEWMEINRVLVSYLKVHESLTQDCEKRNNVNDYHSLLASGIRSSLGDRYRNRKPSPQAQDAFEDYRMRHINDPDYPILIRAHIDGNDLLKSATIYSLQRRSWRNYLPQVRPSNVKAIFAHLAKQDGRKPKRHQYSRAGPLLDPENELHFFNEGKCTLLAGHFEQRFSQPRMLNLAASKSWFSSTSGPFAEGTPDWVLTARARTNIPVLQNFPHALHKTQVRWPSVPFSHTEVQKAHVSLAIKKSPGPDGI